LVDGFTSALGSFEGTDEGSFVVGSFVGSSEGLCEGKPVDGLGDGTAEGLSDGSADGLLVLVGSAEGAPDFNSEGFKDC
jgi:hypothetical protein